MPRHSRKHKRGGRPPNTSTDDAEGNSNGEPVEYTEPENSDRMNNIVEQPRATPSQQYYQTIDPRPFFMTPEQRIEYQKQLDEGNRLAAQDRRRGRRMRRRWLEGRQGPFTRIYNEGDDSDDDDDDDDDDVARGGRKKRRASKRRKTTKKRKTTKRRKTTKKRRSSKRR